MRRLTKEDFTDGFRADVEQSCDKTKVRAGYAAALCEDEIDVIAKRVGATDAVVVDPGCQSCGWGFEVEFPFSEEVSV